MLGTLFTNHPVQWINVELCLDGFSKISSSTCAVFQCSWSAGLRRVIFMMDANPLLNSLHPLPKWCSFSTANSVHQTPALTGSEFQRWKYSAHINCHTTKFSAWQSFHHHYHSAAQHYESSGLQASQILSLARVWKSSHKIAKQITSLRTICIRWEDNIKMDLQEVGGGHGDWMELAQDRDRWRALVGTVRDFRVP
jgi:hypothetical protein